MLLPESCRVKIGGASFIKTVDLRHRGGSGGAGFSVIFMAMTAKAAPAAAAPTAVANNLES